MESKGRAPQSIDGSLSWFLPASQEVAVARHIRPDLADAVRVARVKRRAVPIPRRPAWAGATIADASATLTVSKRLNRLTFAIVSVPLKRSNPEAAKG